MIEIVLVFGGVALASAALYLPWGWLVGTGAGLIGAGLLLGVPTGLWYHVVLRRVLRERDALPARWWLHPTALHPRLDAGERARVLPWFYAGGAGFLLTALGCAVTTAGALRLLLG